MAGAGMRIVGGELRGRRLATPAGQSTRPTTDRAREALFNKLQHAFAGRLQGARVLDLFAGSGALGLEALSRGAGSCLFIEMAADARGAIRANVEALGLQGRAKLFRRDATRLGGIGTMTPFDLVFADPPYSKGLGEAALASALAGGWLADGALCMVEEARTAAFETPTGFRHIDTLTQGGSVVRFLEVDQIGDALPADDK